MYRKAFKMYVNADQHEEYHKRHSELWPEMEAVLKKHGLIKYAIFLDEDTSVLYAYLEVDNKERWDLVSQTYINQKWWKYMAPIMATNADHSPKTENLKQVFYIEK
ncbi:L-rhamnose mutarotase [Halolactibacillus alkaliphilus]|uniref:L-rhamnose mutarotase n=1 Tax=Halolactibacillus alkaliphilus TaxID=442899 RepID=A0A511WXF8_9BACI|nr:L-rhamnose mutarotase [Halolactibacillus alkaliphilus]GEN55637.1 L-rhamnose mutarotase [Halolactibacillus alkaliphilus]GGN63643.1 L-rhamnose mutarotase [Halolactibacillus alkaliphilus]SFO62694.1 L-rhamnose mutarotase [Halolactibacillus alkaliphilus]